MGFSRVFITRAYTGLLTWCLSCNKSDQKQAFTFAESFRARVFKSLPLEFVHRHWVVNVKTVEYRNSPEPSPGKTPQFWGRFISAWDVSLETKWFTVYRYSEIPLLRPPKIQTFYPLKTLFAKFKLFLSSFSTPSAYLIRDHLCDCPKVVLI